jgi:hypothetical protein
LERDDEIIALDMQQQLGNPGYEVEIRAGIPSEVVRLAKASSQT